MYNLGKIKKIGNMKTKLYVVVFLAALIGFGACGSKPKKETGCEIISFKVGNDTWTLSGDTYSFVYCKTFPLTNLSPTIVVSNKAKYSPTGAQDFSEGKEVTYTVTAEDGKTKTYKARASNSTTACP